MMSEPAPAPERSGDVDGGSVWEPVAAHTDHPEPAADIGRDRRLSWLRSLAPLLRPHRRVIALSLVSAMVAMAAQVALPRIVMLTVDRALDARTDPLTPFVVVLAAVAVLRGVTTFGYRFGLYHVAYRLEYDLRVLIHRHLGRLSFSFYDRVQTGQIISRANSDIRSVQMFGAFAPIVTVQLVTLVGALVVMLSIDPLLTVVAVAGIPGVYVAAKRLRDAVFPISWLVQARLADLATVVDENVNGARVVKAFAAEEREIEKLAATSRRLRWISVGQADARARWNPVVEGLPRLSLALVLAVGGWRAADGVISVGALLAFSQYVLLLAAPFRFLGFVLILGQRARASAGRILELLDEEPTVVDRPGAVDLVEPSGSIRFDDVRFAYDDATVLEGVDLEIHPGETVALVGRSGSGKSTIARLLLRFYDVDGGRVTIDGHDVRDLTQASLRRHVAFVPDDPFLFSTSLHDNIAYAHPAASRAEVTRAARDAAAAEFIDRLPDGYDTVVGERGYDLSGGQRQRVSLARGLVGDPAVLVLDDATSAVDVRVEEEIHEALSRRRRGRTTIVIAHRLSTIALADRVVLLEGGRIVADGSHEQLLAEQPRYVDLLARSGAVGDVPTDGGAPDDRPAGDEVVGRW
ncbi:MAG: ABC transporter ATP-binding protein [Actinomycetota bacterium]